jgi:hypothetical protein
VVRRAGDDVGVCDVVGNLRLDGEAGDRCERGRGLVEGGWADVEGLVLREIGDLFEELGAAFVVEEPGGEGFLRRGEAGESLVQDSFVEWGGGDHCWGLGEAGCIGCSPGLKPPFIFLGYETQG